MRRRFGRGRRTRAPSESKSAPIDAAHWFGRLIDEGIVGVQGLEPVSADDLPASFAVVGSGEREGGEPVLVGFSPSHGGDAMLAALAVAQRLAEEDGFEGEALAVAPQWSIAARRRLALVGDLPFRFRALAASSLDENEGTVEREPAELPSPLPASRVAHEFPQSDARELFLRAFAALEGLAAKHGGAVRGAASSVDLVLLARCVAVLRMRDEKVMLETLLPERSSSTLSRDGLAAAMDRLEGQLRKRLNDRRVRGGEEGVRAQALARLAEVAGLREVVTWPLGGSDPEVLDLVGLDAEGRPVLAAVRRRLSMPDLAAILDAAITLRPALPVLFSDAAAPLRLGAPRLALVSGEIDAATRRLPAALTLDFAHYELRGQRGGGRDVVLREAVSGAPAFTPRDAGETRGRRRRGARTPKAAAPATPAEPEIEPDVKAEIEPEVEPEQKARVEPQVEPESAPKAEVGPEEKAKGEPATGLEGESVASAASGGEDEEAAKTDFEDLSLFDLDDELRPAASEAEADETPKPRRRRRPRRRGRRGAAAEEEAAESPGSDEAAEPERTPAADASEDIETEDGIESLLGAEIEHDPSVTLAPLAEEIPDAEESLSDYEDEEDLGEENDWAQEREMRRRARLAKMTPEPEPEEPPKRRRRRSAIVAHADRDSVAAAVLLARDLRLVESFWVYPQAELMTFFRSVATDLGAETPIYVVGFAARPARDTIQTAALYNGRLAWYDHQDWPPEDLESLRNAIGAENVDVQPGSGSSIPAVLADRTRRSRFSDKLVELVTGRFSEHDYERWGRLWWHRLGEIAQRTGEQRSAIDALLAGRPSDLAKQAAAVETPPVPEEVRYASERDFRVVHFAGYALVVVPVPMEFDLHLTARVVRERMGAQISLAHREIGDLVVLSGEEARGRQGFDIGSLVSHLASKHDWIEALRDEDHMARMRVRDLATRPERLDEVVADVAMGRSMLEG
jgi:hypothetical protein